MKQPLTDSKMRIVQTFWTAGQDPLKCDFGWRHAEYNLCMESVVILQKIR